MKKVLIIDDDIDFAESLAVLLTTNRYRVLRARDGEEGVEMAAAEKPDVILCDVMMRERTEGFFTIQRLRRIPGLEATRILVISSLYNAIPAFQVPPDPSWLGQDGFLAKPIEPNELLQALEADP